MNFWELLFFHHLIPWLIAEKIEDEWEGENTNSGRGGAGPGWDFGYDFIPGMGIHIPSRLEFGTGMRNDHTMWDGNGIRVPRPTPAPLPTLVALLSFWGFLGNSLIGEGYP